MRLFEYEAKEIFSKHNISVPRSRYAENRQGVFEAARILDAPVVIKPQTTAKARGKAGLIRFADTPQEAAQCFSEIVGRTHGGEIIRGVLVEEKVKTCKEFFLAVTVDYADAVPVLLGSPLGGVDVEADAKGNPRMLKKIRLSPSEGVTEGQAFEMADFLCAHTSPLPWHHLHEELQELTRSLYRVFRAYDCELVEINPLALTEQGPPLALDALITIDDESQFRHLELVRPRAQSQEEFAREQEFKKRGWTYIPLEGEIGILSSGAGITMAILDLIHFNGGKAANFLDTAQMDRKGIYDAFQIFHKSPNTKVLLVNIFAGLNRCDELALGITDYLRDFKAPFPIVVRMIGNKDQEGRAILEEAGIKPFPSLEEAVAKAIEEVRCVS